MKENNAIAGSYRTYEEWKPIKYNTKITGILMFLPYLWGMETIIHLIINVF